MPKDREPRPNGVKLTENGAQPVYPTERGLLEAAVMRSVSRKNSETGRNVVYVEPTTPEEIAVLVQEAHDLSSNGTQFPIDFRQAVKELEKKRNR